MIDFAPIRHSESRSVVDVWCDGDCVGSLVLFKGQWQTNEGLTKWLFLDEPLTDTSLLCLKTKIVEKLPGETP